MTGWIEDVKKLIDDIKDIAKNPKSHFSYAKDHGIVISDTLLGKIAISMKNSYLINEDFIGIKREDGRIKVVGFRHEEVALMVS